MSDYLVYLNEENFEEVISGDKPVIIDFWAEWCRPCLAIAPLFEKLAEQYNGRMIFAKLNTDQHPSVAASLGITSIPTFMIIKQKQVLARWAGAYPQKLKEMVEQFAK